MAGCPRLTSTSAAIAATLERIARWAPGSRLVLDYDLPKYLWDSFEGWDGDIMRGIAAVVATTGEPWVSLFTPQEVEALLRAHGYDDVEHLDHDTVRSTYMSGHPPGPPGPHPWQRLVRATVPGDPGYHQVRLHVTPRPSTQVDLLGNRTAVRCTSPPF